VTNFDISNDFSERHIINVMNYFSGKNLPFIWLVSDFQNPEPLIEILTYYGFSFTGSQPGMALDLNLDYLILNPPSDLSFSRVKSEEDLKIFAELTCKGFELPQNLCYTFLLGYPLNNPLFNMFIGYYEQEPVCVGLVAYMNGVASIHNITTLPESRKKGFGTAITLKLLREAKKNKNNFVTLHSSDIAHNIYRGIGFMDYTKLQIFEYQVGS
jgi:ribosomal protein S18 acetylase RimI-like enzyme